MTWKPDDEGFTLLHCFGCHAPQRDLAEALGLSLSDLFDNPKPYTPDSARILQRKKQRGPRLSPLPPRRSLPPGLDLSRLNWTETAVYPYTDADGTVVQQVVREEAHDGNGRRHKQISQRYIKPTGGVVKRKPAGFTPTLYCLPDMLQAIADGVPVWIVEGEKDADTARAQGLAATTNAGGAGQFPLGTANLFSGADVVIVVDQDKAGYERGDQLAGALGPFVRSLMLLLPALDDPKADLTDHFEAGHGVDDFVQVTPAEMHLLALAEGVRHAASRVTECEQEISAWLGSPEAKDGVSDGVRKAVGRWAEESHLRWGRAAEAAKVALKEAAPIPGERARRVEAAIIAAVSQSGDAARLCYAAAELRTPGDLSRTMNQAPAAHPDEHVPAESGTSPRLELAGSGGEPPVFDGNTFIEGDDGRKNIEARYVVRQGKTVQVRWTKVDGEYVPTFTTVIHGWAEIDQVLVADDGHDQESTRPDTRWVGTFYRWARTPEGNPAFDDDSRPVLESEAFSWGPEELRSGAWINHLPWPGLLESATAKGKDQAMQALLRARPAPAQRTPIYTATGWRKSDTGSFFVHAAGALAKGGTIPVKTELPGPFEVYTFPDPCTDPSELRRVFDTGIAPLLDLPPRIVAPLLGITWRSFLKPVRIIAHLAGGPGSGKTALARAMIHHAAPSLSYAGERREILSGSNKGATVLGLIRALEPLSHLPTWIDDFTADGDLKRAQQKLDELIRAHYNATGRVVSSREGTVKASRPSQATVITTAEFAPSGSAATRALVIPVNNGDIRDPKQTFADIERSDRKSARNLVAATLITWLIEHRDRLLAEEEAIVSDYGHPENLNGYWSARAEALPHTDGAKGRMVEAASEAEAGVRTMMAMLVDRGGATAAEASQFIDWAREGIWASLQMQDASSGDAGEQLIAHLREALSSQAGHLATPHGVHPAEPLGMGWMLRGTNPIDGIYVPMGPRLGILRENMVMLLPNICIRAARQVAAGADLTFAETATSISSSFLSHGWIAPDAQGARCVARRINGVKTRVWEIPLEVLTGPEDDGPDTLPFPVNPFAPHDDAPSGGTPAAPAVPSAPAASGGMSPQAPAAAVALDRRRMDAEGMEGTASPLATPTACVMCMRPVLQLINGSAICWSDWRTSTEENRAFATIRLEEAKTRQNILSPAESLHGTETAQEPSPEPLQHDVAEEPTDDAAVTTQRDTTKGYDFAQAVLDADGLWTPDGVRHELEPWPRHAGDVAALAGRFNLGARISSYRSGSVTKWLTTRGAIWITAAAAERLDIPVDKLSDSPSMRASELTKLTTNHSSLLAAIEDGWTIGGKTCAYTAWTRVYRRQEGAVLAMIPVLDGKDSRSYPIIGAPVPGPAVIAKRLELFSKSLGHPLLMGSSSTGMDLMFALPSKKNRDEYFKPSKLIDRVYESRLPEPEISWSRKPTEAEAGNLYVHGYDRSGSYLAGTKSAILPVGDPTHHPDGCAFDEKTPGYWRIQWADFGDWRIPNPVFPVQAGHPDSLWVTTPTLALAVANDFVPTILEAYTWNGSRILDGWADRCSRALNLLGESTDPDATPTRNQVKRVYTETIGMMNSIHLARRGGDGYAPERRDTIIGRSKANLLRRVIKIGNDYGHWPVAIGTDSIVYTSSEPDPIKAWPGDHAWLGRKLGQYHHIGSALLSEHLEHLTGHGYRGLEHLKESTGQLQDGNIEESA
ncbi:hypothetical protein [Arthrobacter sp. GAS37]|uniref:hypothetical protein n=1 Tax=Arthrobacter sp. GAS37 TaxID=3156261 RepID=UPI00384D188F